MRRSALCIPFHPTYTSVYSTTHTHPYDKGTSVDFYSLYDLALCFIVIVVFRSISLPFIEYHTCHFAQHLNLLSFGNMLRMVLSFFYSVHHTLDDYTTHLPLNALTTSFARHCFVSLRKRCKQNRGFFRFITIRSYEYV